MLLDKREETNRRKFVLWYIPSKPGKDSRYWSQRTLTQLRLFREKIPGMDQRLPFNFISLKKKKKKSWWSS